MRRNRIIGKPGSAYHCVSRIIERRFYINRRETEIFRKLMHRCCGFTGLELITFAILDNHVHLLLRVPPRRPVSDEELSERLAFLYTSGEVKLITKLIAELREAGDDEGADAIKKRYTCRMYDLSQYMKTLKQRYSQSYNRRHERKGTLWEGRFKSTVVEESSETLLTMANYIDLNPVRAGIVEDPRNYRFCGYAEAVAGSRELRRGLARALDEVYTGKNWRSLAKKYRKQLHAVGEEKGLDERGQPIRKGFSAEQIQQVLESDGELSVPQVLRCRVRYFTDGVALGSREFVEQVFQANREQFGKRRKNGARKIKNVAGNNLFTLRGLRLSAISITASPG